MTEDLAAFLDAAEARAAAATPGPWYDAGARTTPGHDIGAAGSGWRSVALATVSQDARFIVAARSDVPALVGMVRAVLALCEQPLASDITFDGIYGYTHYVSAHSIRAALRQ